MLLQGSTRTSVAAAQVVLRCSRLAGCSGCPLVSRRANYSHHQHQKGAPATWRLPSRPPCSFLCASPFAALMTAPATSKTGSRSCHRIYFISSYDYYLGLRSPAAPGCRACRPNGHRQRRSGRVRDGVLAACDEIFLHRCIHSVTNPLGLVLCGLVDHRSAHVRKSARPRPHDRGPAHLECGCCKLLSRCAPAFRVGAPSSMQAAAAAAAAARRQPPGPHPRAGAVPRSPCAQLPPPALRAPQQTHRNLKRHSRHQPSGAPRSRRRSCHAMVATRASATAAAWRPPAAAT